MFGRKGGNKDLSSFLPEHRGFKGVGKVTAVHFCNSGIQPNRNLSFGLKALASAQSFGLKVRCLEIGAVGVSALT